MIGAEVEWDEELLLYKIGDYNIFEYYIPNFKLDTPFSSPFREDSNPSCSIKEYNGRLWYKDFGDPYQSKAETCVQLIKRIYGLKHHEAIEKIKQDVSGNPFTYVKKIRNESQSKTIIRIKRKDWTTKDIEYWKEYGISTNLLDSANVSSISHFWINNNKGNFIFNAKELSYAYNYYWNEGIFRRKIYQPNEIKEKWFSNVDKTIVQGWNILPKTGNLLVITKSFKDVLALRVESIYSVASNNEKSFIPDSVFEKLKTRWNKIVIWYDNDETGIVNAKRYSEQYEIPYITTEDECKDPSDFRKKYGQIKFKKLLKKLL